MRESQYDSGIREFSITDRGIVVAETFESAEAVLTGHARLTEGGREGTVAPPMDAPAAKKKKKPGKRGLLRRRRS
jgi:circadian clock protein KaiC